MHFNLIDQVLDVGESGIVTIKNVTAGEEYLQDHFPTFPVLPGVMMIEAMVQAARRWIETVGPESEREHRYVLGSVRALKYGSFVRPGEAMRVTVTLHDAADDGTFDFKGMGEVVTPGTDLSTTRPTCVSGRFTLRRVLG